MAVISWLSRLAPRLCVPMRTALLAVVVLGGVGAWAGSAHGQSLPEIDPIDLDGRMGEAEWAEARVEDGPAGTEYRLAARGDTLYLAVRGRGFGWVHLYLPHADTVRVVHASAALGTALYVHDGRASGSPAREGAGAGAAGDDEAGAALGYMRIQAFTWAMRDTAQTVEAMAERGRHFDRYRWVGSTNGMGDPSVMELKVHRDLLGPANRIALVHAEEADRIVSWPAELDDGTVLPELIFGTAPEVLRFDIGSWRRLPRLP